MKVAIVHEWLESYAGSERVLEQIMCCYPDADVFALVDFVAADDRGFLMGREIKTSFVQRLPFARRRFRMYLPIMPLAVEQFDLSTYDLVITSSHAVSKGVITGPYQVHVCYMHSPMRYAWDLQGQYLKQAGLENGLRSILTRTLLHWLRIWDLRTANGVDHFIANSSSIAARIHKVYRRDAVVVHPPVDIEDFTIGIEPRGDQYVIASRFVPYKRVDLVVSAFARKPERKLLVIGNGPDAARIHAAAAGATNIEFREPVSKPHLIRTFQTAIAFIFAAEEDFGITMVEAQACGTPVIAFSRGGAKDIVVEGQTGVLFSEQTVASIGEAVDRFEAQIDDCSASRCRVNAERFSKQVFRMRLRAAIDSALTPGPPALTPVLERAVDSELYLA